MTFDVDDATTDQIASETYFQLIEFMKHNPALCLPLGLDGSRITLESQAGPVLTIVCVGPEQFTLEQDRFPIGGLRAEPRRWYGVEIMSAEKMDRCVRQWLRNPLAF